MSTKNQGKGTAIIPSERIESKIYLLRGKKVIFDRDLAWLYEVTTGNLIERCIIRITLLYV
jgi:hypothetical protein